MKNYFKPDEIKDLISEISFDWIIENKIDFLIIDVDNTLVVKGTNQVDQLTNDWLIKCIKQCKTVLICSNNTSTVAHDLAKRYGCFGFNLAIKPFKIRLNRFISQNNIEFSDEIMNSKNLSDFNNYDISKAATKAAFKRV